VNELLKILDKNRLPGNETEIFRLLGMTDRDPVSDRIRVIARGEIQAAREMIEPKGVWATGLLQPLVQPGGSLSFAGLTLKSQDLHRHLTGYKYGVMMAVTIGKALETAVDELFFKREFARAAILDAVGSQFAEEAADQLSEVFRESLDLAEQSLTRRFSPGYGDWNIQVQPEILKMIDAERIGMESNEAHILIPRKSITAVAGYALVDV
jgi:hypothetical protein